MHLLLGEVYEKLILTTQGKTAVTIHSERLYFQKEKNNILNRLITSSQKKSTLASSELKYDRVQPFDIKQMN